MKVLVSLLMVLCFVFVGCSGTDEETPDGAAEASVEVDVGAVDQAGEAVQEASVEEDVGVEEASVPEDSAMEAGIDAETD